MSSNEHKEDVDSSKIWLIVVLKSGASIQIAYDNEQKETVAQSLAPIVQAQDWAVYKFGDAYIIPNQIAAFYFIPKTKSLQEKTFEEYQSIAKVIKDKAKGDLPGDEWKRGYDDDEDNWDDDDPGRDKRFD